MAIPAVVSIIGAILGNRKERQTEQQSPWAVHGHNSTNVQPNTMRRWDEEKRKYVDGGTIGDVVQPGQQRYYNEGTGSYGDAPPVQQGGGMQRAVGKAGTIAGLLQRLQGNRQETQPYQMQMRRR